MHAGSDHTETEGDGFPWQWWSPPPNPTQVDVIPGFSLNIDNLCTQEQRRAGRQKKKKKKIHIHCEYDLFMY